MLYQTDAVTQTLDAQAAAQADILTDAAQGRELLRQLSASIVVALTFNDGWDLFYAMGSPGRIRSNKALQGWKSARAEVTQTDVDYL